VESEVFASQRPGIDIGLEIVGDRPGGEIAPGHPLVSAALDCLREQGIKPYLNRGSTDANIPFSRGLPAVCIGLTTGSGAHTLGEYIHTKPLKQGIAQLVALVERAFQLG
jgi:di/tripeptidase